MSKININGVEIQLTETQASQVYNENSNEKINFGDMGDYYNLTRQTISTYSKEQPRRFNALRDYYLKHR